MTKLCTCIVSFVLFTLTALAFADVPKTINYQGYLTATGGIPATGPLGMTFSLYSSNPPRNGNYIWRETQPAVPVTNGIYSTQLGSVIPITAPLDVPYYLGVKVESDNEMPLQPLTSVPYALRAGIAESALTIANPQHYLLVQHTGSGSGNVTSSPPGINSPMSPLAVFQQGTTLTLSALPDTTSTFSGWIGACSGTGPCTITMDSLKTVTAAFVRPKFRLTTSSTGGGTLVSDPLGIYCGAACSGNYDSGSIISLISMPNSGQSLKDWGGECSGSGTCTVIMDGNKSVFASFGYLLTTNLAGGGGGTITSAPAGISCTSGSCAYVFNPTTVVTLTASPNAGATFIGWSGGACTGNGPCVVTMSQLQSINAAFTVPLNVSRYNNGGGTVVSTPGGINCGGGGACTNSYVYGTELALTAVPDSGATFNQWTGCDSINANTCNVNMNAVKNVQVKFAYPVTVAKNGTGGGTVTGAGLTCGPTCSGSFGYGDSIVLVATPDATSTLAGWTGCDSVSGSTCTVSATSARTVSATFTRITYTLTTTLSGGSGGTITSNPAGISCGATCSSTYAVNTAVSLTATPNSGATFTGWSGSCTGTGTCAVTMDQARNVTASFSYPITISKSGTGGGVVTSSPAAISCGATCAATYTSGTAVTLTASPDANSGFSFWTGCDSTTATTCTIAMNQIKSISAQFDYVYYTLTTVIGGTGSGTLSITSTPSTGVTTCSSVCGKNFLKSSSIAITATPDPGSSFTGWSNCPSPSGTTCTISNMQSSQTITANVSKP